MKIEKKKLINFPKVVAEKHDTNFHSSASVEHAARLKYAVEICSYNSKFLTIIHINQTLKYDPRVKCSIIKHCDRGIGKKSKQFTFG